MKTPSFFPRLAIVCFSLLAGGAVPLHAADSLQAGQPVVIKGTKGRFDFLEIDPERRRLLAAHAGNGSLDVIDLDKREVIKVIPTGAAQDSAVDARGKRYLVSVSKPPQVAVVDADELKMVSVIPLEGPGDLVVWNSKSAKAYVGHDDGKEIWVVDPAEKKVTATVALPGENPEGLAFDASFDRLFQCLKTASTVTVFDPVTRKLEATWPTDPVKAPHGVAMLPHGKGLLVAGGNGKLVLMSQKDGHVISSLDIPAKVDQIAYDPELHRVYGASGTGKIFIASLDDEKLSSLGEVNSSQGCHSIAVDPQTHTVWVAYLKGDESTVQPFTPVK